MKSLSNAQRNRILARSLFVDASMSYTQIANTLTVSDKTVQNYKIQDKKEGFDWLTLRASKTIEQTQEQKENMYSMFTSYMMQTLKEIRENENLSAENKAQMIVSLGDSFSKMGKVARQEDPEAYKYSIIKFVIQKILLNLKDKLPQECMQEVIETIYSIQDELSDVFV